MTLTEKLNYRRNDESPLGMYLTLSEVFDYFEQINCTPIFHNGENFIIRKDDIIENGRFNQFAGYTLKKFGRYFGVTINLT